MGTELEIKAIGTDPAQLDHAIDAAITEMQRVEDLMTSWRPSELTQLNAAAGPTSMEVPRELAAIIARGLEIGKLTGGAFDITFAGVGRLWQFKEAGGPLPAPEVIATALASVGYDRVRVTPETSTVHLPQGMQIGLGGIAKGYGVDRAISVLRQHGVTDAIVNAGGDMKALGRNLNGPWEVAIKHPRDRERALAVLNLENTCIVTSGDYERFFEHDGERYHHILDPRTGYPSRGCMSATVLGYNAELSDSIATALCVLSPAEGIALVESLDRIEALLVDQQGAVHVSPGLQKWSQQ